MPDSALTTSDYWSRWHRTHVPRRPRSWGRLRAVLRWLNRGHESHLELVRARATDPHLPPRGTLIELGCAPGQRLLSECHRTGLEPHGVDYSEVGYRATLDTFAERGADASGIMHADFTDESFRRRNRNRFDVVWSAGLVEHFTNPEDIVRCHLEILKPGGTLIVSIPNFRGIGYPLYSRFAPDLLSVHNLDIMERPQFDALFEDLPLETMYCGHIGTLSLPLAVPPVLRRVTRVLRRLQNLADCLLINLVRHRDVPNRFTSPYLLYVGRKR